MTMVGAHLVHALKTEAIALQKASRRTYEAAGADYMPEAYRLHSQHEAAHTHLDALACTDEWMRVTRLAALDARYEPITYDPSDGSAKGVRG